MNSWLAALLSTLLFTVTHGYELTGLVGILVFGMLMCWFYHKSGSLWPGLFVHAFHNFLFSVEMWFFYYY
jgi:membrane protease YdiL (CAAX protease family)